MNRDAVCKTNDFGVPQGTISAASGIHLVKDLNHSGAMPCNLCLELAHFPLQSHRTRFNQRFLKNPPLHIVLFEPEMPPTTGNIAKLSAKFLYKGKITFPSPCGAGPHSSPFAHAGFRHHGAGA